MSWEHLEQGGGGEGGIRTPGTGKGTSDFESGAFNRALPPLHAVLTAGCKLYLTSTEAGCSMRLRPDRGVRVWRCATTLEKRRCFVCTHRKSAMYMAQETKCFGQMRRGGCKYMPVQGVFRMTGYGGRFCGDGKCNDLRATVTTCRNGNRRSLRNDNKEGKGKGNAQRQR
jgi:hypothetical protein